MHRIVNTTPFRAALDIFPDRRGVDTLHVTLKATFRLGPALAVSDDQAPIRVADEYTGEPASSSLRYPGERHLAKPGTDILLVGEAHAPRGEPVTTLDVALAVGPVRKVIRVAGDRQWQRGPTPSAARRHNQRAERAALDTLAVSHELTLTPTDDDAWAFRVGDP